MVRDRSLDEFAAADADAESDGANRDDSNRDDADCTSDARAGEASDPSSESPDGETAVAADSPVAAEVPDLPDGLPLRPAVSTMDWTSGGAPCAACGTHVERRWRDGDGLVCADCKEW
ncbi:DUF7573 domain-containing protein [Halomarina ordinaria]|uniref:DUF7573 domain-containing protein n=1 Tax=Halomarina ordinaria TaxID=3033939 RepID=A0ABD5U8P6_9EURY|nr:hypothetical protein [Halomarina sp. PSRA2]